jgi:hypothetical protein
MPNAGPVAIYNFLLINKNVQFQAEKSKKKYLSKIFRFPFYPAYLVVLFTNIICQLIVI